MQAPVCALGRKEIVMRALFHDGAVFHDEDEVSIANGGQAVGNDKGSAIRAQRVHRFLDEYFCLLYTSDAADDTR